MIGSAPDRRSARRNTLRLQGVCVVLLAAAAAAALAPVPTPPALSDTVGQPGSVTGGATPGLPGQETPAGLDAEFLAEALASLGGEVAPPESDPDDPELETPAASAGAAGGESPGDGPNNWRFIGAILASDDPTSPRSRAIVSVNGQQRLLRVGDVVGGRTLVEVHDREIIIEEQGERQALARAERTVTWPTEALGSSPRSPGARPNLVEENARDMDFDDGNDTEWNEEGDPIPRRPARPRTRPGRDEK